MSNLSFFSGLAAGALIGAAFGFGSYGDIQHAVLGAAWGATVPIVLLCIAYLENAN